MSRKVVALPTPLDDAVARDLTIDLLRVLYPTARETGTLGRLTTPEQQEAAHTVMALAVRLGLASERHTAVIIETHQRRNPHEPPKQGNL